MERGEGIRRGAENPFSDIGPQRGPYFLVEVISLVSLKISFTWFSLV